MPTRIAGIAAPLMLDDVDTDQIIPVPDMLSGIDADFGARLFARWRFDELGNARDDFVLNRPPFDTAAVLVTGANFGCGSSREHAVWALSEFGIRCILAVSFADIFRDNCRRQGIATITMARSDLERLASHICGIDARVTVDLGTHAVDATGLAAPLPIPAEPANHAAVVEDEIGRTQAFEASIARWEEADRRARPWIATVWLDEDG